MINYFLLTNFCMVKGMAAKKLPYERLLKATAASIYYKLIILLVDFCIPFMILSRGVVPKWVLLIIGGLSAYFLSVYLEKRIIRAIEARKIYAQYKQLSFWQRFGYATLGWLGLLFVCMLIFFIALYFDDILGW